MRLDDLPLAQAGELRDVGQVRSVVGHRDLDEVAVVVTRLPAVGGLDPQPLQLPSYGGHVGVLVDHHQQRRGCRDQVRDAGRRLLAQRLGPGDDAVGVLELDEQRPVAVGEHGRPAHRKASTVTPAASRPARTDSAIATAPGESPCTHTDSASIATTDPSTATT